MNGPARSLAACLALGLAGLAGAPPAQAAPDWLKVVLLDAPTAPASDHADVAVLYDRVELIVDPALGLKRLERRVLRILRPAGVDQATFAFGMEPGGRRVRARAWTVGAGRDEVSKDTDVVETTLDPEHYSDVRRVILRAPRPRVGDLVAVEFATEEHLPFASYAWTPQFHGMPVARAELALELPAGWSVAARITGFVPRESTPDTRRHEWQAGPFEGETGEESPPPHRSHQPRVMLRFAGATGAHEFQDWGAVARWYHGLAAPHFAAAAVPSELMTRGGGQPLVLAREVQHGVGYAAIELGGQRWEPDAAQATWVRRYGDCKDKAVLLVAALRAAGIEAQPALVCTREAGAVDPEWPDPRQFNHCIVAIAEPNPLAAPASARVKGPSGRGWTLFDPTDASTAFGLLPWSLGGTYGVIADPVEGLVHIPAVDPGRIRFDLKGTLAEDGTLSGHLRVEAERGAAGWLTTQFGAASEDMRRQRLAQLLSRSVMRADVDSLSWLGPDSSRYAAALEAEVHLAGAARRAGRSWLVTPPFPLLRREPPPGDSSRVEPYWMGWSPAIEARLDVELPSGLAMAPQAATTWSGAAGDYRLSWQQAERRLVLERRSDFRMDEVPAAQWADARGLLQAMYTGDNAPVILKAP
jgi:uncharacterized protein DUF3857/transglutaminase superfamily protein